MSSSSPKKNSITSLDEYYRLDALYHDAYDRVQSGGTGAGYSGIHDEVMNELRKYGLAANSREETLRLLKQLLTEYEKTELGSSTTQSDEDYLSKFDDT
ncbi:MAG TPA: hypothetical protein VJ821_12340 [Anaerolineales bacterium]|nr:hypothetical protein [Anaerolineales bacterium]